MRLLVLAVGTRMPRWADDAFHEFERRMPRELALELTEIKAEPRRGHKVEVLVAAEGARLAAAIPRGARVVALDERGRDVSTRDLAVRLENWRAGGADVAFLVGGPDGLDPALKGCAAEILRLSSLTLPHALARVVLAEALYRAWTVLANHPYHRE